MFFLFLNDKLFIKLYEFILIRVILILVCVGKVFVG